MESGKKSLEELTTAGVFHVPEYQRYYSWTEPEWDEHVVATAGHLIASQPRELFQDRNARMLARVCDLSPFMVPAAVGTEAAFTAKRLAYVALLFKSPNREHRRSTPVKNRANNP